jgi:ParB family chromosome partitioning protein
VTETIKDIPLEDLVIGKGQVRIRDVAKRIDELANSISVMGLLEPIVVCPAEKEGKYEILMGQRRFLAHQRLGKKTIRCIVRKDHPDEASAKALSLTENLVRSEINTRDAIDACTALYKKYGSIDEVASETGLPKADVAKYVKYDRLPAALRKLVDDGKVDLKTALKAADMAAIDETPKDAVKYALEMSQMGGALQLRLAKVRKDNPDASADDVIELAKAAPKTTRITVELLSEHANSLSDYAKAEGTEAASAAADLIVDGLSTKGFINS